MIKTIAAAVLLMLGISSNMLQAHTLRVCKVSDTTNPVTGTFQFSVSGYSGTLYAAPGSCSNEIIAPSPTVTITELTSSGTELIAVWANPSASLTAFDLTARTATVDVPESAAVSIYFKNRAVTGNQGCTPGFWKNHLRAWSETGYEPSQTVVSVFTAAPPPHATRTLLQALQGGGGSGIAGAQAILLRAGVAALLNASHTNVSFPLSAADIIAQVNAVLAPNISRSTILSLAEQLDRLNNGPGGCPLGGPGTK